MKILMLQGVQFLVSTFSDDQELKDKTVRSVFVMLYVLIDFLSL
jgi:hypothetical protein